MSIEPLAFLRPTTDPALPAAPFERVHYSFGQLLGADEMLTEQRYHHVRHRLHQLALHGFGVVCGLRVTARERQLVVEPGLAVDALGRDLFVDAIQCLPVPALHTTELWGELTRLEGTEESPLPEEVREARQAWVVIRYRSCYADNVAAYGLGCGTTGGTERPSRVRDTFTIGLEASEPPCEPWVGRWAAPSIDGQPLPASWRDAWLEASLALPGDLGHLWDGTHDDTGIALARVTLGITGDGVGGEQVVVLGCDLRVRPLLPRVQPAIAALSGVDLDRLDTRATLRLREVEVVTAWRDQPIELLLHFTAPVVPGTVVPEATLQAHALGASWAPVPVAVAGPEPDARSLRIRLDPVPADTPIRITLFGDGATPIASEQGLPLSGWSTEPVDQPTTRGRTVSHHLIAPAEEAP